MDAPENFAIVPNSLTLLSSSRELEEREDYESDASAHDHKCDEWYGCNVDKEWCMT